MVNMDPMENRRKRQRNSDNDGIGYNYMNSSVQLHSTNQEQLGPSPSTSTSRYPYTHSANNSINERNQTGKRLRTESYFMSSSMNNPNHQAPSTSSFWANNSFSERNTTTNPQRGLRGNYIRPSILDREKNKPYSRILKIRPKRERNDEIHIPHMTTTAMKIVESLAKNSSPVVQYPSKGPPIQFSPSLLQDRAKTSPMFRKDSLSTSTFHQNMMRTSSSFQNQNNSSLTQRNDSPVSTQQDRKIHLDLDTHLDEDIKFSEPLPLWKLIKMYKTSKETPAASIRPSSQAPTFAFNTSVSKEYEYEKSRTFDNSTAHFSPKNKTPLNTKASVDSPDNKSRSGSSALFGNQAPSQDLPLLPPIKPFTFPKNSGWECPSCMVNNKDDILSCVCCAEPKPGSKREVKEPSPPSSSTQPFSFGISATSASSTSTNLPPLKAFVVNKGWECSTCMVNNKVDDLSCICCSEPKPGSKNVDKNQNITTTTPFSFGFGAPTTKSSTPPSTPTVESGDKDKKLSFTSTSTTSALPNNFSFGLPSSTSISITKPTIPSSSSFSTFDSNANDKNAGSTSTSLFPTATAIPSVTPSGFSFGLPASTTSSSTTTFNCLGEVKDGPKTTEVTIASTSPTKTTTTLVAPTSNNFSFGLPSSATGAKRKSTSSSFAPPAKSFTLDKPSENLGLFGIPTSAFGQDPSQPSLLFSSQTPQTKSTFNPFPTSASSTQTQEQKQNSMQVPVFTFGTSAPKENDVCKTTFATTATPSFSFGGPSSTNMNSIKPAVVAPAPTINSNAFSFGSSSAIENKSIFGGPGQSHAFGGIQAPSQDPPQYQMFKPQAQLTTETQQNSLFNNNSFSVPQIPQQQPLITTNNIQPPPPAFNLTVTPNFNFGALPAQTQQPGASVPNLFTFSSTPQADSDGGSIGGRKIKQARRRIR